MVSQSVLLRGVNDDADTLEALMRAFVETRVKPYYLHHADLAPGTAHLRTSIAQGQALMRELRRRLSGLAMPAYVLDIPGARGKAPIGPAYISSAARRRSMSIDPDGRRGVFRPMSSARMWRWLNGLLQRLLLGRRGRAEEFRRRRPAAERAEGMGAAGLEQHLELAAGAILGLQTNESWYGLPSIVTAIISPDAPSKFWLNCMSQSGVGCTSFISLSQAMRDRRAVAARRTGMPARRRRPGRRRSEMRATRQGA